MGTVTLTSHEIQKAVGEQLYDVAVIIQTHAMPAGKASRYLVSAPWCFDSTVIM
jgi:hypothetical protein